MAYIAFAAMISLLYVQSGIKRIQKEQRQSKREQYLVNMRQEITVAVFASAFVLFILLLQKLGIA